MADSPKATETAQALFCAIVDKRGKKFKLTPDNKPDPEEYKDFINDWEKEMIEVIDNAKV